MRVACGLVAIASNEKAFFGVVILFLMDGTGGGLVSVSTVQLVLEDAAVEDIPFATCYKGLLSKLHVCYLRFA